LKQNLKSVFNEKNTFKNTVLKNIPILFIKKIQINEIIININYINNNNNTNNIWVTVHIFYICVEGGDYFKS
jgi:hypothetical protein